jgi:hypothetical protein
MDFCSKSAIADKLFSISVLRKTAAAELERIGLEA